MTSDRSVVAHFQFDSLGQILDGRENVTRYQFTGREHDPHTDYNYHRARWYDPTTGRWLSEDPIRLGGGDVNLSRYVGNGPTNGVDPSGLTEKYPGIPATGGRWLGTPGDSYWAPDEAELPAVMFRKGQPDFTPHMPTDGCGGVTPKVEIDYDSRIGKVSDKTRRNADYASARKKMRELIGNNKWVEPDGYVWHHHSVKGNGKGIMILVKERVHSRIPHWGAFSAYTNYLKQVKAGTLVANRRTLKPGRAGLMKKVGIGGLVFGAASAAGNICEAQDIYRAYQKGGLTGAAKTYSEGTLFGTYVNGNVFVAEMVGDHFGLEDDGSAARRAANQERYNHGVTFD